MITYSERASGLVVALAMAKLPTSVRFPCDRNVGVAPDAEVGVHAWVCARVEV